MDNFQLFSNFIRIYFISFSYKVIENEEILSRKWKYKVRFEIWKIDTKVINPIVNSTLLITYYVLSIMFSSTRFQQWILLFIKRENRNLPIW